MEVLSESPRTLVQPSSTRRWAPLLEGDLRESACNVVLEIAQALPEPAARPANGSLAGGEPGIAIFHAYLAISGLCAGDSCERHRDLVHARLQAAIDILPEQVPNLGLYTGFVGLAWAANHAQSLGLLPDADEFCDAADDAVLEALPALSRDMLCELIAGLAGVGIYGVSRWHRLKGRAIVERVVRALRENAVRHEGYLTWFSTPEQLSMYGNQAHPQGCFNLGLSHGVPGAIVFLARAAERGVPGARALLIEAMQWLLKQQRDFPNGSRFAYSFFDDPTSEPQGSRLAWCYGDLGVCAAIMIAARALGRREWTSAALDLARRCAVRPIERTGVVDAGLCHGAFGNAHIFSRLHAATREPAFRKAALQWTHRGLSLRQPGQGLAGFQAHSPLMPGESERPPWSAFPGLLEGVSGIGLALLALLTSAEPAWDQMLMVDIPPAGA